MGETIKVKSTADDGFAFAAYHATPAGPRKGGVVVVQEIFGIDEHVKRDVDRWASMGFEALAPSLYDRREPGFVSGHDGPGMAAGIAHARATPLDQALADIAACRDYLAPRGKVFIVGYCYGGSLTWLAAAKLDGFSGASSYYGSMVQANAELHPKCPTIVHLGRLDAGIPADAVKAAVQGANPQTPVHIYDDAGHGFNNEDPARHNSASADLARRRTLELFEV
jgi:carboxymethylenebutenolidase